MARVKRPAGGGGAPSALPVPPARGVAGAVGFGTEAEGGEAQRKSEEKGNRNATHQEKAEVADHRGRREVEGQEAGGGGEACGGDRGAAGGGGATRRIGAGETRGDGLVEAGLELDRVVDGEADQDRQDGDRGHRQRAAGEAEEAEDERRRREGDGQRQQAHP